MLSFDATLASAFSLKSNLCVSTCNRTTRSAYFVHRSKATWGQSLELIFSGGNLKFTKSTTLRVLLYCTYIRLKTSWQLVTLNTTFILHRSIVRSNCMSAVATRQLLSPLGLPILCVANTIYAWVGNRLPDPLSLALSHSLKSIG